LRCKAACALFALAGGNEIFAQAPCAHLGGNELSPISRRCTSSLFHMVGPASDNVAPKSTSPRHRRNANIVSPELPARQLAASVLQKARKQLLCKAARAQLALARGNEILAPVPCSHVRGNELSPISRQRIFSSFHLVGPASDNVVHESPPQEERKYCSAEVACATACSQCSYKRTGSSCAVKPLAHHSLSWEEKKYLCHPSVAPRGSHTAHDPKQENNALFAAAGKKLLTL
jgi:hypothetical protein